MNRHQRVHRPALREDTEEREWRPGSIVLRLMTQEIGTISTDSGTVVLGNVEVLHACKPIRVPAVEASVLATFDRSEYGQVLTLGLRFVDDLPRRLKWRRVTGRTADARWVGAVDGELRKELRRLALSRDMDIEELLSLEARDRATTIDLYEGQLVAVHVGDRHGVDDDIWLALAEDGEVVGAVLDMAGFQDEDEGPAPSETDAEES